ncbi:amidase [Alloalcanivorax sp. C16-1]|uniref:amidase n=1 Tax=Alloalcanivorax sp. C16-1 TaxID=3390051 RepID=UPI0039707132
MKLENGFLDFDPVHLHPTGRGTLDGRRFAVKDVYDIAGTVTGIGHPLYRETHSPADHTSPLVEALLAAGAELVGKTHTDELTYSLAGQNVHYGTPPNPAVPDGIPGGSSSGSASVVAAGLVDFALGSDTGGSVRVPASYCGVYGLRPTHGRVDDRYTAHLAKSFDTLGWFAADAATMAAVGKVLMTPDAGPAPVALRLLREGLDMADETVVDQLRDLTAGGFAGLRLDEDATVGPLDAFFQAFRPAQAFEAWQYFGEWITTHRPEFGPGIRERFAAAAAITPEQAAEARATCDALRRRVRQLVSDGTVLCLPTTPTSAIPLDASDQEVDEVRFRTLCMTAVAGTAGLPQLSLPLLRDARGPVGLSLIGPPGSDRALLDLAVKWEQTQ